jgi:hypothetical protein
MTSTRTARLLSVNVGLPRDVPWRGNTVHTAAWKTPVQGRRMVRRLNIDGDRQGDLDGHGGEHRPSASIKSSPTPIGKASSAAMTSSLASSAKTSPSTVSPTRRSALAIAIESAMHCSK